MNYQVLYFVACFAFTSSKPLVPLIYVTYPTSYATPYFVQTTGSESGIPNVQEKASDYGTNNLKSKISPDENNVYPTPLIKSTGSQVRGPAQSSKTDEQVVQVLTPVRIETPGQIGGNPEAFAIRRFFGQGDDGSYTFGYNEGPSSRVETGDQFGNKVGGFNYIDGNGQIQSRIYTAGKNGVIFSGTDIPVDTRVAREEEEEAEEEEEEEEEEEGDAVVAAVRDSPGIRTPSNVRSKREANPAFFTATANKIRSANFQVPFPRVANPIVNPFVQPAGVPTPYGVNPIINPVATSIINPTQVPIAYYAVQTPDGTFTGSQFPLQYSGIVPVQPVVYSGAQATSFKTGKLTEIPHSEDTFSYRVDT